MECWSNGMREREAEMRLIIALILLLYFGRREMRLIIALILLLYFVSFEGVKMKKSASF